MSKQRAAVFLKWIVFEKSTIYPKISNEIKTNEKFPRKESNHEIIQEFVEKLNDREILSEYNQAWNEYRTIPRISKETELKPLLPGGYQK